MTDQLDRLTGRIAAPPSALVHDEILAPQFRYEARYLLPFYVTIEKVLLLEYRRMGLMSAEEVRAVATVLNQVSATDLTADPRANMSDITFALEQYVTRRVPYVATGWHVDRSRNDIQACAQMLFGRAMVHECALALLDFGRSAHRLAATTADLPMPGYTHMQAAQVISPGFYLSAVSGQMLRTLDRLDAVDTATDMSPLGAGAMAGQELAWDRPAMAALLGCRRVQPDALTAVASRGWAMEAAAEFSLLGVALSRFATDLMSWGSNEYGFIDLPDELSGISSAMPQKKNFPVLERIRGRTGHLTALYFDVAMGQRNTPFSNMIEVSKESGAHLITVFDTTRSTLLLFRTVLDNLTFRADRMRAACDREFLGGFALANMISLRCAVPWRTAQVIAGEYIVAAIAAGSAPAQPDPELLASVGARQGHQVCLPEIDLAGLFDADHSLRGKNTAGSAHPESVRQLLGGQAAEFDRVTAEWQARERDRHGALVELDRGLGLS